MLSQWPMLVREKDPHKQRTLVWGTRQGQIPHELKNTHEAQKQQFAGTPARGVGLHRRDHEHR